MKYILYAAFLLFPLAASAQSIELKGFGGVMMNTKSSYAAFGHDDFSQPNALAGIGAAFRKGHFEYGLSLSYRRYSFKKTGKFISADEFDPVTGYIPQGVTPVETTVVYTEPAFAIAPVFNYHFGKGRVDWYAGVSPAFIRYTLASPTDKHFKLSEGANGWSAEGQVGGTYALTSRFRVFGELHGGYVHIPYMKRSDVGFWNLGINAGVQLRVWEKQAPSASLAE